MKDQSAMSSQPTLWDLPNAISSPGSQDGAAPSDSPECPPTGRSGQEAAPASATALPARAKARGTTATCGRYLPPSSASAALSECLASRLQQRLALVGSTVYAQTWKRLITPSGAWYWAHTARALTTSGSGATGWQTPNVEDAGRMGTLEDYMKYVNHGQTSGCRLRSQVQATGWPTPNLPTGGPNSKRKERGAGGADLEEVAGWPSPQANKITKNSHDPQRLKENGSQTFLADAAHLTGWPTPRNEDSEQTGAHRGNPDTLNSAAKVAGWPTPDTSEDHHGKRETTPERAMRRMEQGRQIGTAGMALLSGPPASGGHAATEKRGALNPALSRWLMGFPGAWDSAAILAHRSMSTTRRKPASCASKATATP